MCKLYFDAICENLLFIHHTHKMYQTKTLSKLWTYIVHTYGHSKSNMPHGDYRSVTIIMYAFMQSTSGQQMYIHSNISRVKNIWKYFKGKYLEIFQG